jgi:hypothetical protein
MDARLQGRWGALVNRREDIYAWGILIDESGAIANRRWILSRADSLSLDEAIAAFKRVHCALLTCYAPEAWHGLDWVGGLWRHLADGFDPGPGQTLTELVALDAMSPPLDSHTSWFPLLGVGAYMPWIYSQRSDAYRGIRGRGGLIGELFRLRPPLCELFVQHDVEQTAAFGFDNVKQMQRGIPPGGFLLRRCREALGARNIEDAWSQLRGEDWRPTLGDYLGPVHWRYALNAMQCRYRATLVGNEARRGWAMQLVRRLKGLTLGDFANGIPAHLDDVSGLGLLIPEPNDGWSQEQENLLLIDRFLCLFAAICRWEPRSAGALTTWKKVTSRVPLPDSDALGLALGYLLHVGRDVFEFYLMLWELAFAADADDA